MSRHGSMIAHRVHGRTVSSPPLRAIARKRRKTSTQAQARPKLSRDRYSASFGMSSFSQEASGSWLGEE